VERAGRGHISVPISLAIFSAVGCASFCPNEFIYSDPQLSDQFLLVCGPRAKPVDREGSGRVRRPLSNGGPAVPELLRTDPN
jgi:hypothetical protein